MGRVIMGLDMFGMETPGMSLRGKTHVNTFCVGVFSSLIVTLTLAFAAYKLVELVSSKYPSINIVTTETFFDNTELLTLSEVNCKVAFSLFDLKGQKILNDTKFLQWYGHMQTDEPEPKSRSYENIPENIRMHR